MSAQSIYHTGSQYPTHGWSNIQDNLSYDCVQGSQVIITTVKTNVRNTSNQFMQRLIGNYMKIKI